MATNGTITIRASDKNKNGVLDFVWVRESFDPANKTSKITWGLFCTIEDSRTMAYKVKVNGTEYKETITDKGYSGTQIKSGSFTLQHDNNGNSVSFPLEMEIKVTSFTFNKSAVSSYTIYSDAIPIPATIVSADDFTDETTGVQITYINVSNDLVDDLQACLSFTGAKDDIPYRSIDKKGDAYLFTFTDAEKATLRKGIKQGSSTTIRFYVRTRINGVYYHSSLTKNLTLVNYLPTCNPVITDTNARCRELTGSNTKFIKYFSNAAITINASAKKEASILSRSIINGSQNVLIEDAAKDTATIEGVDSNTFYFTIQDSRGYETQSFKTIDLVEYTKLTTSLTLRPLTLSGNLTIVIEGNYYNGSFGAKKNSLEFEYGLRKNGGDITWTIIDTSKGTLELYDNSYRLTYTITGLDPNSTYKITSNAIDELMSLQTSEYSVTAKPVYSWGKNDFKHNTPVYLNKNLSLRTIDNDGNDISVLNPCNPSGNLVLGWGQYDNANGNTQVYGNNVHLTAKENVIINGKTYGKNQVLWSGGSYMNGTQYANLSQAISSQPHGIVLVFSLFTNGAADNTSINSFFVSKQEVAALPNAPHTFFMMINAGFSVIGAKYLYIDDTKITGHTTNTTSGSNNGFNFNNDRFVLRYVIGV